MTTYFPFTPSNTAPPTFQPTLDGSVYTCTVVWSLFGKRYNLNCNDSSGDNIFTGIAVVNTLPGMVIESLSWSAASLIATVITSNNHNYKIGSTLKLTVQGASPSGYNGTFMMLVTDPVTLTFPLSIDPGNFQIPGILSYLISLTAGYFDSTLIFRNGQFEVSP